MNLLDRAIARHFLVNIGVLTAILFAFVVVVDVSINLDRFQKAANALAEEGGQTAPSGLRRGLVVALIIADLWWPWLLQLFNFMAGAIMLGAMGFTATQLTRHRELLAMVTAGISLHRVARPFAVVAAAVGLLQLANMELVIPRIAPLLIRDHGSAGRPTTAELPVPLTPDGMGRLFYARRFDPIAKSLESLFIIERDPTGLATRVIRADSATWDGSAWALSGGLSEPRQGPDTQPKPIDRLESSLDPARLTLLRSRASEQALGFVQIARMLDRPELTDPIARARLTRIQWSRFAVVLCGQLALAIAMPFLLAREPAGITGRVLRCIPLSGAALLAGLLGSSAGIPGIPPGLSVFAPVVVLLPVAAASVLSVRT